MGLNPSLDLNFLVLKDRRRELRHCGGDEQTASEVREAASEADHPREARREPGELGHVGLHHHAGLPDPLTPLGAEQARAAGRGIREAVSEGGRAPGWKVYFYVSPYERTRSTLREIGRAFPKERILGVREECRIREQDFGNFQVEERMKVIKETRERFGRFFFRFPEGESAADVFDRVASFMESLWRDIDMKRIDQDENSETNLVIVSHGLTTRVFPDEVVQVDGGPVRAAEQPGELRVPGDAAGPRRRVQFPDPPHAGGAREVGDVAPDDRRPAVARHRQPRHLERRLLVVPHLVLRRPRGFGGSGRRTKRRKRVVKHATDVDPQFFRFPEENFDVSDSFCTI
uniref:Phosphoglycerate mutase-like protein AT74H n=1 Tax=Ananas comosus var. bracteatus TaxID=296719 RepID=A0A6V7PG04_ANACO|nr:unnamed protein product [Ananas comosus var. bracteatus]